MFTSIAFAISLMLYAPYNNVKEQMNRGNYEDALVMLSKEKPKFRQHENEYHFLMASCHCMLNHKAETAKWLQKLDDSFEPKTYRHEVLMNLMKNDIARWKEGDLGDISRDMKVSRNRLSNAKGGKVTQKVQDQIVKKLDKLIKEQEDKAKEAAANAAAEKEKEGKAQRGGQPFEPLPDSMPGGTSGSGKVDEKKLKSLAENWGTMPEKERAKAMMELSQDLPPRYREIIENYAKAIAKGSK